MENIIRRSPPPSAPLRILHVTAAYYPAVRYGGPIRTVHGLCAALVRRGHDVHVYTTTLDGDHDLEVPVDQPHELDGVSVRYFPVPAFRRLAWAPALTQRLRESIYDFDVVHTHGTFQLPMAIAARVAARTGVPYVCAPHGMLMQEAIRRKSRWLKGSWINLVARRTLRQAAAVQVTATLEGTDLLAQSLVRTDRLVLVLNGLDPPATHLPLSQTPYANLPPRYALFLSRINWKKGLDRLITAWQHVPSLPLVIVGNDEERYQLKLEALARSLGLSDRVLFAGPAADQHKWALYEQAQLFLLPSYSENFGVVVGEAMAMGCPVVVTPDVGMAEHVRAAGAGVVIGNEPVQLSEAVNALLRDEAGRREMGRRGREVARRLLSWDGIAAQMEALYVRTLHSPTAVVATAMPWQ
jgi:glycosyltransferase involved in cell wall biosynthesis